jgi:post-segregation antitoxin (ccd killing protein)
VAPASSSGLAESPAASEPFHLHGWQRRGGRDAKGASRNRPRSSRRRITIDPSLRPPPRRVRVHEAVLSRRPQGICREIGGPKPQSQRPNTAGQQCCEDCCEDFAGWLPVLYRPDHCPAEIAARRALLRFSVRRIVRRMPRLQVYLPDDLYDELKRRDLPASELLQVAVRAELERRDVLEATDDYLSELSAEVGEPTARQQSRADAIVRRIRDRRLHQTG